MAGWTCGGFVNVSHLLFLVMELLVDALQVVDAQFGNCA